MRISIQNPELLRRVVQNLEDIAGGKVTRLKDQAKMDRQKKKDNDRAHKARIRQINKALVKLKAEADYLEEYLNEILLDDNPLGYAEGMSPAQCQGLLEECDSALEGCRKEIGDLEDEKYNLQGLIEKN